MLVSATAALHPGRSAKVVDVGHEYLTAAKR